MRDYMAADAASPVLLARQLMADELLSCLAAAHGHVIALGSLPPQLIADFFDGKEPNWTIDPDQAPHTHTHTHTYARTHTIDPAAEADAVGITSLYPELVNYKMLKSELIGSLSIIYL